MLMKIVTATVIFLCAATCANAEEMKLVKYGEGYKLAIEQNKPLVTWVGCCYPTWFAGAVTASTDKLEGYSDGDVVISKPASDGLLYWYATIKLSDGHVLRNVEEALKKATSSSPISNERERPTYLPPNSWSPCPNGNCLKK